MKPATPAVLAFVCLATAAPAPQVPLDSFVASFLARRNIPGASIAVVHDGRLVLAKGYGTANLELAVPASDKTVYEIGSISKQFTAEAVMMLVEEGKLGLDDRLSQYLAEAPAAWSDITVRHVLTHTSGLPDWEGDTWFSYRREYTTKEFIAFVEHRPLDFRPGDRFAYTNSAHPLLGVIVERVSGVPYEQFVTRRIFGPAGMTDTRFKHPEEIVANRAGGYVDRSGRFENGEPLRPRVIAPNGGIMSTVLDMAKWDLALSNGVLLKPATLAETWKPLRLNDGRPFDAGFAWFLDTFRGHRHVLHNGSTVAGFSSVVYRYLDDRLFVVVLMNVDRWNAVNVLATAVASYFVPGLAIRSLAERPDPDPAMAPKFLAMLAAVADGRDTEALAPNLRNAGGPPRARRDNGYRGAADRFAFLEREDMGERGQERFGNLIRWIYRYKLVAGPRIIYYTFEVTPEGKVARFFPEEE